MEIKDVETACEELRRELAQGRGAKRSKKWRCPPELQSRVVSYAKACREQGEPIEDIAGRLGLVGATLCRWLRRDRDEIPRGFRSVAIVSAGGDADSATNRSMRLISPRGYSVEGLDAQTLAYLLQVVG